jgi:pyruvate,water dikinase
VIRWFDEPAGAAEVGGKGAALGVATRAGLPVPPGFCVTVKAMSRLASTDVVAALEKALSRLAAPAVAVRSSASEEDGGRASFAGVFVSELNVHAAPAVIAALERIRTSARSPSASAYVAGRGMDTPAQMAAVVQAMVFPETSGVLFTRDPLTGEERFVVEGSWGLGEAIVSGEVTPDHFVLSPAGALLEHVVADKDLAAVAAAEGTMIVEVEASRRHAPCLAPADLRGLVDLGRRCEAIFGGPQDVEWAIAEGRVWLLQSRPITARGRPSCESRHRASQMDHLGLPKQWILEHSVPAVEGVGDAWDTRAGDVRSARERRTWMVVHVEEESGRRHDR